MLFTAAWSLSAADSPLRVGVQTWTLRNLNFEQMVAFAVKHNLKDIQCIAQHIDPNGPMDQIKGKKAVLDKNGLTCYTFGVAGTSLDKEQNRKLFEFARVMGSKLIVVEPNDFKILDNLEELAKEYDIKVAIHNHGIKSLYGNPAVVKALLKHRDPRIGVCLDVGWATSGRFDAAKVYRDYEGRVFDIHLKDKKVTSTPKGDDIVDTFIGEGDTNFAAFFKALKDAKFAGVLAIETDKNLKDPTEHVVKALEFVAKNAP